MKRNWRLESVLVWREFYVPVCLDMNILRLMDFKCVSYESICGIGYRVFAASGKYFMGKGKSVCDYCNPFPYCFKSNSAIIIALPDLFYRRGIFAACVMNMGILGIVFFWYRGCHMEFCILQRLRFYCW